MTGRGTQAILRLGEERMQNCDLDRNAGKTITGKECRQNCDWEREPGRTVTGRGTQAKL